jgi:hypothetical protein
MDGDEGSLVAEQPMVAATTPALLKAIGLLGTQFPEKFHSDAWRKLTAELANREMGYSIRPIKLARKSYNGSAG